jgi:hypothetical protein
VSIAVGLAVACGLPVAAGCGDDSARSSGPAVTLRVTRDFGRELLAEDRAPLQGRRTLLSTLRDHHEAKTDEDGRHVFELDGMRDDFRVDVGATVWATNVNGIETDVAPIEYRLHDGDVVQWDLRSWDVTLDVRATVGAFPETFTRGVFGRRFPVTVRCEKPASPPCQRVERVLRRAGVPIDGSTPPGPRPPAGNPRRARVRVGSWRHLRRGAWARRIEKGAGDSGVFARFTTGGDALELLDRNAHRVRTVGAGAGLVAAMRPTEEDLAWYVTGVDDEGVERAARALDPDTLRDAFALVVTAEGPEKLPVERR